MYYISPLYNIKFVINRLLNIFIPAYYSVQLDQKYSYKKIEASYKCI